jgi:hypothetical protein
VFQLRNTPDGLDKAQVDQVVRPQLLMRSGVSCSSIMTQTGVRARMRVSEFAQNVFLVDQAVACRLLTKSETAYPISTRA